MSGLEVSYEPVDDSIMLDVTLLTDRGPNGNDDRTRQFVYVVRGFDTFDQLPELVEEYFAQLGAGVIINNSWQLLPLVLVLS